MGNLDWEGQSRGKEAASSPGSYCALPGAASRKDKRIFPGINNPLHLCLFPHLREKLKSSSCAWALCRHTEASQQECWLGH